MKLSATTRRTFIKTTALALPFLASGCANFSARKFSTNNFVSVRDGKFTLRGKPYFYVGANMWFGCYVADAALPGGRARLVRELDRLQKIGATNVRLLAGSETSPLVVAIDTAVDGVAAGNETRGVIALKFHSGGRAIKGRGHFHERVPITGGNFRQVWIGNIFAGGPTDVLSEAAGPLPII